MRLFKNVLLPVPEENYILKNQNISGYKFRYGFSVLQIIAVCIIFIGLINNKKIIIIV